MFETAQHCATVPQLVARTVYVPRTHDQQGAGQLSVTTLDCQSTGPGFDYRICMEHAQLTSNSCFILIYKHTSSRHCVGSHVYQALACAKQTLMSSIYHPFIQSVSSPAQYHCKDASYPSKSLVATGYPVQQIQIKCVHAVTYIIKTERPVAVCFTIHYYDTQKGYQCNFGLKLITMSIIYRYKMKIRTV